MDVTVYQSYVFANLLGMFLLTIGIIFASRVEYYTRILRNIKVTESNMLITGIFMIFLGLFLIAHHNVWILRPRVLMTVVAWIVLLNGLLMTLLPEKMVALYYHWMTPKRIMISSIIWIILGIVMVFDGARLLYLLQHH